MSSQGPAFEARAADWLDPATAQRRILSACRLLPVEEVPLAESRGRALGEDIRAEVTLPPWDNAAMDGYAVRAADVSGASPSAPVALRVSGYLRAGGALAGELGPGEAIRIMTGAPLPPGADSVIRVEDTDAESVPGRVLVRRDRDRFRHIRPRGGDVHAGELVLERGLGIHAGVIGVLAALGREHVLVHRRPTVAILATGEELRGPGAYADVRAGVGIPDSNTPMLAAQTAEAGGVPHLLGIVPDDAEALLQAVQRGASCDVLLTVGGASLGEADLVKRTLDRAGFRQEFWRVRMRPGSPFSFGWLPAPEGAQAVFGLPGNPASAFVTFEIFVRPFLLSLAGHRRVHRRRLRCLAGEAFPGGEMTTFQRVVVEPGRGEPVARHAGPQSSGLVRSLAAVQGLAVVESGPGVAAGDPLDVLLLDPTPAPSDLPCLEAPDP